MTDINTVVAVTVNVADTKITQAGFGTLLIFSDIASSVFPERVRSYASLTEVAVDFAATTKVYKAAAAIFAQARVPTLIKVGRHDTGDASLATALDAIQAADADWYGLVTDYKASADLQAIAAWIETQSKIALISSEDVDVLDSTKTTDIASILKAAGYDRTGYMWHDQAGSDATGASYSISAGVATIGEAAHGRRVGDPVTFLNSSGTSIDGDNVVASVPDANTFTVATTAADFAGPGTVDYFAGYTFPECAWMGYMLPSNPGSETWKFKQLTGVVPVPSTVLTDTEEANALAKKANIYSALAGVGSTHEGTMASGRFIDIQRGIDWLQARLGEAIASRLLTTAKIPYTDAGAAIFEADMAKVLDDGVNNNVLGPLLDGSGNNYVITMPKVANQTTANRTARYFPGATIQAQLAGAVHSLAITVNASV